jgi:hypothetical protein
MSKVSFDVKKFHFWAGLFFVGFCADDKRQWLVYFFELPTCLVDYDLPIKDSGDRLNKFAFPFNTLGIFCGM